MGKSFPRGCGRPKRYRKLYDPTKRRKSPSVKQGETVTKSSCRQGTRQQEKKTTPQLSHRGKKEKESRRRSKTILPPLKKKSHGTSKKRKLGRSGRKGTFIIERGKKKLEKGMCGENEDGDFALLKLKMQKGHALPKTKGG